MATALMNSLRRQLVANTRRHASADASSAHGEHGGGMRLWKILSFTVAVPGVIVCWINSYIKEKEHHEHHVRPEFVKYEHMYRRTKPFPWGDGNHSLLHNKEVNALPEGYED